MFRLDVSELSSAATGVLQVTQDIRVAYERTDAALSAVLPTAGGQWYKTGSLATSQFKRDLGELKGGLTKLSDAFGAASATASGTLLPQYGSVLNAAGAGGSAGSMVYLDEGVSVDGSGQYLSASFSSLARDLTAARDSLAGLEDAAGIAQQLDSLATSASKAKSRVEQTQNAFSTYKASVASFEGEYGARFDTSFNEKSLLAKLNDGVKDAKGVSGVTKHGFSLGATAGKILDNTWEPSQTKPFAEGFSGKMFDWARPEKWREAWNTATGTSSAASAADDVGDAVADAAEAASSAGNWTERASAVGKIAGYVGDGLSVLGIAVGTAKAYDEAEGDAADKAAEATYTAVSGAAKFATGKAVGAAVGTMVGGPVGTAVGFLAGCAVDLAWNYASDWMEESGAKDAIVGGMASAYRETGKLITSGYDWLTHALGG